MDGAGEFHTLKGYQINRESGLTASMEDYLEMICRLIRQGARVRVGELSEKLHVKPSSVSKMIRHLNDAGYIDSEKYGYIRLTEKGEKQGEYLLYRHDVLHKFLCLINGTENELEQVEKIEHFLNKTTVENLDRLTLELENGGANNV